MAGTNGTVIHLAAGEYEATVVSVGAGLARLAWGGTDLVLPFDVDRIPPAYQGKTLIPWPNRIADGRYDFGGVTHELPVNEHATGTSLHGLACWQDWEVATAGPEEARFTCVLVPRYGYPFHLRSEVTYRLTATAGLEVTIESTNIGTTPAPYGSSTHPYLTCGLAPVDECTLECPAGRVILTDERLLPRDLVPVEAVGMDFRAARLLGDQQVDHAFGDLPPDGWQVTLAHPGSGVTSRLSAREPWLQIYSGELLGRRGAAVEPMTCPPDAFNSGTDLVVLEPGQSHAIAFRIDGGRQ
jgi:aldose 1-epimerase